MKQPIKPPALRPGDTVRVVAPSSSFEKTKLAQGIAELQRLGYHVRCDDRVFERDGYFAGPATHRLAELTQAFTEDGTRAIVCARGGYGADTLLPGAKGLAGAAARILLGFSDVTSLQIFLWQELGWITLYGPMLAAGLDHGPGAANGYDLESLTRSLTETSGGWAVPLQGEMLAPGTAEGTVLGGCLTLVESTLGTPWELDTRGAILLLEDRAMKPYQVDRSLMHLRHAGKFADVRGIILGDFPECATPPGQVTLRDVLARHCRDWKIPAVWGVPFGHTARPMLTFPLGIRARLTAQDAGKLDILEAACKATD
jgi:muramoyltetrapeptide carboxypeptidase